MKIISQYASSLLNAGPKAKMDIQEILEKEFKGNSYTLKLNGKESLNGFNQFIYRIRKAIFSLLHLHGNELTIIQFPFLNELIFTKKQNNKVAFIHDLEGIRKEDKRIEEREIAFLKTCKYMIAHNSKMKEFLVEKGIDSEKIFALELFDYLCDRSNEQRDELFDINNIRIIYTGNLNKAPFINQMKEEKMNFVFNVYGICDREINNKKILYKGKISPNELPNCVEGDLGLVWDGNYDESDENEGFKNYTRYNNPHKASCYIAAAKPIIVWEKSAVAELVKKYDIGYTIKSVYDINDIDFSDYATKKQNVEKLSLKVRSGYFTKNVVSQVLNKMEG